jgi:hypothetical protein
MNNKSNKDRIKDLEDRIYWLEEELHRFKIANQIHTKWKSSQVSRPLEVPISTVLAAEAGIASWSQKVLHTSANNALPRLRRYGESKVHEKAKDKVANALRDKGFTVYIDSYPFECKTEKGDRIYWPDVYAESPEYVRRRDSKVVEKAEHTMEGGGRRIIVEVQGFKGHKSKHAYNDDRCRIQDIQASHGPIEYYEVHLNHRLGPLDIRQWSVGDICEHLNLG